MDATSVKNRFGQVLEACARGPVPVERHGRTVAYVVAAGALPEARAVEERIASRLRAAGARHAVLFGSLARGQARPDSDIDIAVSFGRPMSADLHGALVGLIAVEAGRPVDLVDLETAPPLILSRALAGRELLCEDTALRARLAERVRRGEDERIAQARAARRARAALFA